MTLYDENWRQCPLSRTVGEGGCGCGDDRHAGSPARGDMPPVTLNWYDGGLKPPTPKELGPADILTS